MTFTEHDLRRTLHHHAASAPANPARTIEVRLRIRRARQRRAAAATTTALAGVTLLAVAGLTTAHDAPPRPPAGPASASAAATPGPADLPTYAFGGRLEASATLRTNLTLETSTTFTPSTWDLHVTTRCTPELPDGAAIALMVNGHSLTTGTCGGAVSGPYGRDEQFWAALGVRLGKPSSLAVRVVRWTPRAATPATVPYTGRSFSGRVTVGMYAAVPAQRYPLPPHPATIAPPGLNRPGRAVVSISPQAGEPNGRFDSVVTMRSGLSVELAATAPGSVTVLLDGVAVTRLDSWDYGGAAASLELTEAQLAPYGLHPRRGQRVRLTVVADRFADAGGWAAGVIDRSG